MFSLWPKDINYNHDFSIEVNLRSDNCNFIFTRKNACRWCWFHKRVSRCLYNWSAEGWAPWTEMWIEQKGGEAIRVLCDNHSGKCLRHGGCGSGDRASTNQNVAGLIPGSSMTSAEVSLGKTLNLKYASRSFAGSAAYRWSVLMCVWVNDTTVL